MFNSTLKFVCAAAFLWAGVAAAADSDAVMLKDLFASAAAEQAPSFAISVFGDTPGAEQEGRAEAEKAGFQKCLRMEWRESHVQSPAHPVYEPFLFTARNFYREAKGHSVAVMYVKGDNPDTGAAKGVIYSRSCPTLN